MQKLPHVPCSSKPRLFDHQLVYFQLVLEQPRKVALAARQRSCCSCCCPCLLGFVKSVFLVYKTCRVSHAWWRTWLCVLQMSDWEKRPLSSRQLEYAALDAFVLLQLYDVISNPNTGLSQAQLQSCLYSHHAQRPSPRRTSPRRLPKDTHPDQQISSQQHPPSQESVPATLPVSHTSSPSRKSSHPSLPSTHSARQRHSRAAAEPSSAVAVTAPWQGSAEQNGTVGSSGVTDRSALQECLQSHGLQSAMRTHSSLGAG